MANKLHHSVAVS